MPTNRVVLGGSGRDKQARRAWAYRAGWVGLLRAGIVDTQLRNRGSGVRIPPGVPLLLPHGIGVKPSFTSFCKPQLLSVGGHLGGQHISFFYGQPLFNLSASLSSILFNILSSVDKPSVPSTCIWATYDGCLFEPSPVPSLLS